MKYEFRAGDKSITKLPLGEDNAQRVLSMNALSHGKSAVGHWLFGTEKILSQERREVTEAGKTWIEFQMTLWRGDMNQATLRVDPETRLPVYLLLMSPKNAKNHLDGNSIIRRMVRPIFTLWVFRATRRSMIACH